MRLAINFILLAAAVAVGGLSGCEAVPNAQPVALQSPEAQRVLTALERLPKPAKGGPALRRTFTTTLIMRRNGGMKITATGVLLYYGPRDFRVSATTDAGTLVYDARMNWAGVTILRIMPELEEPVIESLVNDMSRAFEVPSSLSGLAAGEAKMVLKQRLGDNHTSTWIFDRASGQLEQTNMNLGTFDTLRIMYSAYTNLGWPDELKLYRPGRQYDAVFTFTDAHVVEGGRGAVPGSTGNWPALDK